MTSALPLLLAALLAGGTAQAQFRDLSRPTTTPVPTDLPVQVLLTRAKPPAGQAGTPVAEVRDGDPLWVTVRAPRPLVEYARAEPDEANPTFYELHVAIGPADNASRDFDAGSCFVKLTPQQAARTEFSLSLAPAMAWNLEVAKLSGKGGAGGTSTERFKGGCFLETVAGMRAAPGVWKNRVSIRGLRRGAASEAQLVGSAPLTVDVSGGFARYAQALRAKDDCRVTGSEPVLCR